MLNIEGYVLISMCEYDHYYKDDHATILLNTIYIKKSNNIKKLDNESINVSAKCNYESCNQS